MRLQLAFACFLAVLPPAAALGEYGPEYPRGKYPLYLPEPNATKLCTHWFDYDFQTFGCEYLMKIWNVTAEQWDRWNPDNKDCREKGLDSGVSYCVQVKNEPGYPITTSSTTSTNPKPTRTYQPKTTTDSGTETTTAKSTITPTTTSSDGSSPTPWPHHGGLPKNCNKFYRVVDGDTCEQIAYKNSISIAELHAWNSGIGKECYGLWTNHFVCVSVEDRTPPTTRPSRPTPSPVQRGIISNCGNFHLVGTAEFCADVAHGNGISVFDFVQWNRRVGDDCSGLTNNAYACISTVPNHDFEDGNISRWVVYSGRFNASSKALVATASAGGKAVLGGTTFSDLVLQSDVKVAGKEGSAGVIFRSSNFKDGANNYDGYYAGIEASGSVFVVRTDAAGAWDQLASTPVEIDLVQTHRIKVHAFGDYITVFVNDMDQLKLIMRDTMYKSGANGVRVRRVGATFDNIEMASGTHGGPEANMAGWTIASGSSFKVESNTVVANNQKSGMATLPARYFSLHLDAYLKLPTQNNGNAGIMFRASDVGANTFKGYYVGLGTQGFVTLSRANQEIKRSLVTVEVGRLCHLRVIAIGSKIQVFLDNMARPVFEAHDSTFTNGVCGIRVLETDAEFENIGVFSL